MENVTYKEYSEEENRIYNEAITKILEGLKNGLNFSDACNMADVKEKGLKGFIEDDVLKIVIAEMHYVQGSSLKEIADKLSISVGDLNKANSEMLEDISMMTTNIFNPNIQIGNA
ncbi:MAG: hypothetical protein AB1610_01180 [Nitrospirota bacterium]